MSHLLDYSKKGNDYQRTKEKYAQKLMGGNPTHWIHQACWKRCEDYVPNTVRCTKSYLLVQEARTPFLHPAAGSPRINHCQLLQPLFVKRHMVNQLFMNIHHILFGLTVYTIQSFMYVPSNSHDVFSIFLGYSCVNKYCLVIQSFMNNHDGQ